MTEAGRRRGHAATATDADDPRLRGRTYAVPFDRVWRAACGLTSGGLRGWEQTSADDDSGAITAFADSRFGEGHDIAISIVLDHDAQTRVDASATARKPSTDLGRAARRVHRFFVALDRAVLD